MLTEYQQAQTARLESYWQKPQAIREYERFRKIFRVVNRKIVQDVLEQYVTPGVPMLEVGAGLGELATHMLTPDSVYKQNLVQSEQSSQMIAVLKQKQPDAEIVQASVYDLAKVLPKNHFGAAVCFASADTFLYPTAAVESILEVMQPGAPLLCFLDMSSSPETALMVMSQFSDFFIVPRRLKDNRGHGVALFANDVAETELAKLSVEARKMFDFKTDPIGKYHGKIALKLLDIFAEQAEIILPTELAYDTVSFNEFYEHRLRTAMTTNGMTSAEIGTRMKVQKVPPTGHNRYGIPQPRIQCNVVGQTLDVPDIRRNSQRSTIISHMHIAVAHKA